ncbi:phosphodiesterase [Pseudomonas sp. M30-35]|uniref:phosphodiesterase n=1 Tax=Pseudomonas sp. M30-35 TaxID=1981174 RepID=UPI000B3D3D1D|nr:phosphodiesterase [Pseudomonas sp. M30-35]ARU88882.1 phosphodiesterase [Pseudomonas sp. M30-35]
MSRLLSNLLALSLMLPLSSFAETLSIPIGHQGETSQAQTLPKRGESRRAVLNRYGLADKEHKPVGQPPITRWDYREFSVYFEYDHVVDSVRHLPVQPVQPVPPAQ